MTLQQIPSKPVLTLLLVVIATTATGLAQVEPQSVPQVAVTHLSHKQVKHLIATASTPQDHLVLAEYFRWEAGKMKEEEQYHLEMAAIYRLHPLPYEGKLPYGMQMQNHCKYFANKARDAAKADEELASVHQQIAQQLSQSQ
jgi:hypothetical protein